MLGRMVDGRIAGQANIAGQSEVRRLLYAALLLADDLHERKGAPQAPDPTDAAALEALAERLERMAETLETGTQERTGA